MDPAKGGGGKERDDEDEEEEDEEDEDSGSEDEDTPLTKSQAMRMVTEIVTETIRRQGGFSGKSGKKLSKHSKRRVADVQKEKEKDIKWQRMAFCVSLIEYLVDIALQ